MIGESAFNFLAMADPLAASLRDWSLIPGNAGRIQQNNMTNQQIQDDGVWVITSSFTIFTMTSGFGLLESGRVSSKDEVNIMVKNVIDVIFGGLSYWMFGFGMTFGDSYPNPFIGIGKYFFDPDEKAEIVQGWNYASFIFQMSFATTTSTIVSAGMAERIRLKSYIVISFLLSVVHSIPAHWVWSDQGFFYQLGVIDSAGCSVVHLVGGVSGLVATLYLKPRQNRFGEKGQQQLSNPTNAVLGTFMLWWGWLAFNTGSTYGVSKYKWRLAARSAVATVMSSAGGGMTIVLFSFLPRFTDKKIKVDMLIDGLLASLVSTTASCLCIVPWHSLVIGIIGALLALLSYPFLERMQLDDPVGVVPVHVIGSTWGMIAVGIFAESDKYSYEVTRGSNGLLYGGGFQLLLYQCLAIITVSVWSAACTFVLLFSLHHSPVGLRVEQWEEELGADLREHGLAGHNIAKYKVEKKLTTQSFTAVMKAIIRWKRITREGRLRRERRIAAAQPTRLVHNGQANGVGAYSRRNKQSIPRQATADNVRIHPVRNDQGRRMSLEPYVNAWSEVTTPRSSRSPQFETVNEEL